tara:strand:- start:377 stop:568 length:192 start_codon:yes stop_codon:yes gene_type:complete
MSFSPFRFATSLLVHCMVLLFKYISYQEIQKILLPKIKNLKKVIGGHLGTKKGPEKSGPFQDA